MPVRRMALPVRIPSTFGKRWSGLALVVLSIALPGLPALALDRHVYLDTDGDGILNDCPNPTHNAKGASNTDNLQYCKAGSANGAIIGTAPGRVSAATCTSGGGAVTPVRNGVVVDVDGDGTLEPVYGHPQACVYNMAKSDSCEVHAGVYRKPGGVCSNNCGDFSVGGGAFGSCHQYNCFEVSVFASGYFADGHTDGYGTSSAPGFLRGAVMNGSTDTWDSNGNKTPDSQESITSYAPVISGDTNGNGAFDTTACSGDSCSGDAFHAVLVGCQGQGSGGYGQILCSPGFSGGEHGVMVDTNADGTYDFNTGTSGPRRADYLTIKDIEFNGYNGGKAMADDGSARNTDATFGFGGNGSTPGITIDHIWFHRNDYATTPGETMWAGFGEHHNNQCPDKIEIKNSNLVQNNEKLYVTDLQSNVNDEPSSCQLSFHDNRVTFDITSPRARSDYVVFAYLKPIHFQPSPSNRETVHRIYNNEFIIKNGAGGDFFDIQGFGSSTSKGKLMFYGNLVRELSTMGTNFNDLFLSFCGSGTQGWNFYVFNNTFDFGKNRQSICGSTGNLVVDKNNAFFRVTNAHPDAATTLRRSNEVCNSSQSSCTTPASNNRSDWFSTSVLVDDKSGLAAYAPKTAGPLDSTASCDPDGDGTAGVDYDGDGVNDTRWLDLAKNSVVCTTLTSPIDVGAIQAPSGPPDTTPPSNVNGLKRTDTK